MNTGTKISFVVPARNEEGNLPRLLDDLLRLSGSIGGMCEIIAVNDNSTDNTRRICEKYAAGHPGIKVLNRAGGGSGMGAALREGTQMASGEFVIWLMADRSDDPESIPRIIADLNNGADMVFASRYMKGGTRGELDPVKAFLSSTYTRAAKIIFGFKCHDITNACRGFRKEIFSKLILESSDFAISPEFALKAAMAGFKISEVPSGYKTRKAGKSTFRIIPMMFKYTFLLRYRFVKKEMFITGGKAEPAMRKQ